MKKPFPHDIRAVLTAAGHGLSLKKIVAGTCFLLTGYFFYLALTYIALLYDGVGFDYIWQSYGMFPFRIFPFDSPVASVIQSAGLFLAVFNLSLAVMAGAVINFEEIRGDYFYSTFDAVRFTIGRSPSLLLGYISIGGFVGFIYLLGVLIGLLGRVPVIGEALIGVFYLVPIFITLAFTVFIIFVAIVSVVLLPVVMAAQKERELFGPLLHLFSVVIKEPIRFFWYLAVTAALAKAASFVMAYLFYRTMQFSRLVLATGGGERIDRLFNSALTMLPLDSPVLTFVCTVFPGIPFGFEIRRWGYAADHGVGVTLMAVSFFILFIIICGYMASVLSTGLSRGYAVIRRMKDDYFICEEEPILDRDDYANPPFAKDMTES